jgi:hypothetical protein
VFPCRNAGYAHNRSHDALIRAIVILLLFGTAVYAQLPLSFCSPRDEYAPTVTADGQRMYFTANRPGGLGGADIWFVEKDDNGWSEPAIVGSPICTAGSEWFSAISPDGAMMVLTLVDAPDGFGDCDLYISALQKDGKWSKPKNMGPTVNTGAWESHPVISRDSRTVYFASDRPGGVGGIDLYMSSRLPSGEWSEAKNVIGINTAGNDVTPYISLDDSTLYFSSDGVVETKTDLDIYMSRMRNGHWTLPVAVFGVNSPAQELFPSMSGGQNVIYFCSNRNNRVARMDIYSAPLPADLAPATAYSVVDLKVSDADNKLPVGAQITITAADGDSVLAQGESNPLSGDARFILPRGRRYGLSVAALDFYLGVSNIQVDATADELVRVDVGLEHLQLGRAHVMSQMFVFGSDVLTVRGTEELRKMSALFHYERTLHAAVFVNNEQVGDDTDLRTRRIERLKAGFRRSTRSGSHIDWKGLPFTGESLERDSNYVVLVPILN